VIFFPGVAVANSFDVIVVGSGFGGSVVACRLAEAGARVLVLERGRRWTSEEFPRKPTDPWLYDQARPNKYNGWLDLRLFPRMAVIQGAGVGGGSLCYSSVLMKADTERFHKHWPAEITRDELEPYYGKVAQMLGVQPIPSGQHTQRYKLLQQAAQKTGMEARFQSAPLAVSFDPEWNYDLPDPLNTKHSKPFVNQHGQQQGTCVHLGNCDIGCDVKAKNTLDLNYIPSAERHGAEVRPLHLVRFIEPQQTDYRVVFDRIVDGRLMPGEERSERVVIAAGSLGSTELLLRCRDEYRTLRGISRLLGQDWSANGNFFTFDYYENPDDVQQSIGPTISGVLDLMDGAVQGQRFVIEDDGFPNLLLNAVRASFQKSWFNLSAWILRYYLRRGVQEKNLLRNVMVWLGAGVDGGDGSLQLGRSWLMPWKRELRLAWDVRRSRQVIEAILAFQQRLSQVSGGRLNVPFYWSWLSSLVTVHPLGGCRIGNTPNDAVVDHRGEVFGHKGLYVADGAILPTPIGRNPSMTIAALSERVAFLMARHGSS
jgi:cholesterol oxidase